MLLITMISAKSSVSIRRNVFNCRVLSQRMFSLTVVHDPGDYVQEIGEDYKKLQ